jgi:hypothetical protein
MSIADISGETLDIFRARCAFATFFRKNLFGRYHEVSTAHLSS